MEHLSAKGKFEFGTENSSQVEHQIPQRVMFEPGHHRRRNNNATPTQQRPANRDSISSVRSRIRSVSGVPIGFRKLPFEISSSQVVVEKKYTRTEKHEGRDYFVNLEMEHSPASTQAWASTRQKPQRA
jgi:hypothetical protein